MVSLSSLTSSHRPFTTIGRTIIGTTDSESPITELPTAKQQDVSFILETLNMYAPSFAETHLSKCPASMPYNGSLGDSYNSF